MIDPPSDNEPTVEKCYSLDSLQDCGGLFPSEIVRNPAFMYPSINPNNADQFVYYSGKKVYKFDMSSGLNTQLAEGVIVNSRMEWGAAGWIAFSTSKWKVWKLKDDGTEFEQLTFTPQDLGPEFNKAGDEIIYSRDMQYSNSELQANPELRNQYKIITMNLAGTAVDSFCRYDDNQQCYPWDYCSLSPDGSTFAAPYDYSSIVLYDGTGAEIKRVFENQRDVSEVLDMEWHPDGERLFFTTYGSDNRGTIYVLNVNTSQLEMVKEGCENRFYTDLSIAPDGTFMLVQKGTAEIAEDNCDVITTWRIVKMDIDGENEEVINLE